MLFGFESFQSSHDEITEWINQLFVIGEDVCRKVRENTNRSTHAVTQTIQIFLNGGGTGCPIGNILQSSLVYFTSLGFKWNYIADMFLVS